MNKLKIWLVVFPVFILGNIPKPAHEIFKTKFAFPASEKKLVVGEELTYLVSYSFIKLGEIKLKISGVEKIDGQNYFDAVGYIDSYSIPFVSLHQIYQTTMTPDYYSRFFRGIVKGDDYSTYTEYYFDYPKNTVRVKKGKINPHEQWTDSTGTVTQKYQDGLSIFYYARMNSGQNKSVDVPCFVNEKKEITHINFYSNVTDASIDTLDYKIECVRLDGRMDFISIFGLTGYFEGWFSNDDAAIPILAKMKVLIGNITVELKEWKRDGWIPPKYTD